MKFGVIYDIEWDGDKDDECPALSGEGAEVMQLFDIKEDITTDADEDEDEPAKRHMKFASKELLSREEFEKFLQHTRLTASETQTMGSIIGGAWGLGWVAPAVAFESDSREYVEMAYVTPVPGVPPREFPIDDKHQFGLVESVTKSDEYMERCWQRVRRAVINTYAEGVS